MAETYIRRPGLGAVGQYQIRGVPFVTGSTHLTGSDEDRIQFPYVAKAFVVLNKSAEPLRVHFAAKAASDIVGDRHYITLDNQDDSLTFDLRVKEVWLSNVNASVTGSYQLLAELTGIDAADMRTLSGSGINSINGTD